MEIFTPTLNTDQDTHAPETPFEFKSEQDTFRSLLETHSTNEGKQCINRRAVRRHRVNVAEMRQPRDGKDPELLADETIIPDRTIETNITQEKPLFIQYFEQPQTVISFFDHAQPAADFQQMEKCVTDLFRYENWKEPWHKLVDAILLHGGGFMECVFDPDSTCKFFFEYIRRDHLIIPKQTTDINNCQRVGRLYQLTKLQFDQFTQKYSFNPTIAAKIKDHYKSKENFIEIYKYFMRAPDNTVYISWMAHTDIGADDWLREPIPHFNGDFQTIDPEMQQMLALINIPAPPPQPLPTSTIPIIFFPYGVEEDEAILEVQGRAALDIHTQDSQTTLYSAAVNGAHRASRFYPWAEPNMPGDDQAGQELFKLKHGVVFKGKLNVFQPDYPNQVLLQIAQATSVKNSSQSGQVDFAAMTRQDTAKRATEIIAAQNQTQKLDSTKISLFAQACLRLYSLGWNILRNQVKIGQIQLYGIDNINVFSPTLTMVMSADAQVVRRAERIQKYITHYALVVGTKFQDAYFQTMLESIFPEEFPAWQQQVTILTQQEQTLARALQAMTDLPPDQIPTEQVDNYMEVVKEIGAVLQPAEQPTQ